MNIQLAGELVRTHMEKIDLRRILYLKRLLHGLRIKFNPSKKTYEGDATIFIF